MIHLRSDLRYFKSFTTWHPTFGSFTTWRPNVCKAQTPTRKILGIFFFLHLFFPKQAIIFLFPTATSILSFNPSHVLQHDAQPVNTNLAKFSSKKKNFDFFLGIFLSFNFLFFFRTPEIPHLHFFSPPLHTLKISFFLRTLRFFFSQNT